MKCPNCRTKVPKNYMYCPKCGLSVKAARASEQRRKNVILMGVLALNISACFLIFRCISLRKPASKPNVTAEISSQAETTAAPAAETTAPPETEAETEPATETEPENDNLCPLDGTDHGTTFMGKIIKFFHSILWWMFRIVGLNVNIRLTWA